MYSQGACSVAIHRTYKSFTGQWHLTSQTARKAGFTPPWSVERANGGVNPALRRYRRTSGIARADPVKHGFTARSELWPHSIIHQDTRLGRVDAKWVDGSPEKDCVGAVQSIATMGRVYLGKRCAGAYSLPYQRTVNTTD
jgi:hypothetical protein